MLPVNLNDLTPSHIQNLIDSEVAEGLMLEYKQELPSNQSEKKKDFLYEVAAMANAGGGDIVFGIVDRPGADNQSTGIADSLSGIKLLNEQVEKDRLLNLIRDGIDPRLTGIAMRSVKCEDGDVLVLRIPRSWNKPHMVTIDGVNRFYLRGGTTKFPMRVNEIRRAFSEQSELGETIEKWREHRAELASKGKGPVRLAGDVKWLFHVIPASAFSRDVLRESWTVAEQEKRQVYVPHELRSCRYNADGFLCLADTGAQFTAYGYTQLFRSGIVEYADGFCCNSPPTGGHPMIFGQELEKHMVNCYTDAINRFRIDGRREPLYVGFSLIGITGRAFFVTTMQSAFPQTAGINRDIFTSPEVFVDIDEPEESPYGKTLLPLVDTMWQVGGRQGTPFRPNGEWKPFGRYD